MKSTFQIMLKLCALGLFFMCTPFFDGIQAAFSEETLTQHLVYTNLDIEPHDLSEPLNVMSVPKAAFESPQTPASESSKETTEENNPKVDTPIESDQTASLETEDDLKTTETPLTIEAKESKNKSIYIYNTHQQETYIGDMSVYNAAEVLADHLRTLGYTVIVEAADFYAYGQANGMDYNMSYQISRKFITDAIMNQGGFDLIIDFHRDSVPRENTYISVDGVDYAKMMCVIGGLTENVYEIGKTASTLYDSANSLVNGIMKNTMTREAYYNQDMSGRMILIEVGSDNNTFDEVKNSVAILAQAIEKTLG